MGGVSQDNNTTPTKLFWFVGWVMENNNKKHQFGRDEDDEDGLNFVKPLIKSLNKRNVYIHDIFTR